MDMPGLHTSDASTEQPCSVVFRQPNSLQSNISSRHITEIDLKVLIKTGLVQLTAARIITASAILL